MFSIAGKPVSEINILTNIITYSNDSSFPKAMGVTSNSSDMMRSGSIVEYNGVAMVISHKLRI